MEYEEIISKILGEHTEEQGDVARRVLSFVSENPDWRVKGEKLYKDKVLQAVDSSLYETFGHNLKHYLGTGRKREIVEVRYMVFLLLREETDCSYNEIGGLFGKSHCTVMYGEKIASDLVHTSRHFREDYRTFKNFYKSLL